ncbi:internal virion protein [Cronobacter phage Dev-CD-23823]|uniref:Uncharacterized protein n=1 Tax=Cronobacter phage Dev-CD-23823 TaxID=1712539 RepID=A0A0K8IXC4_9CAUD|nr:internal virion protein [Cronobacter phage Dev-CD-23823]CUH74614.1 hypothetical protein [Cronobacter phage Dev-CD-23823]
MAEGNILPTLPNAAIERGQPIQVNAPLATQQAQQAFRPSQVNYVEASGNAKYQEVLLGQVNQRNIEALSKLSADLGQKFQQAQEDKFAEGYLRHMQGEAVADIAEENPFKGIFGDGAAVRGARAAQVQNSATSILSWVNANQGSLIGLPADAQRKAVADYVQTLNTGDPQADMLIAQNAMKMLPAVMDNLTRASEAENQRQAAVAQADTLEQHAQGLQYAADQMAKGQLAPEHYEFLKAQAIEAAMPMPGQSPESYRAAMQGNMLSLVRNGQFELANTIRSQVLDPMLTPEERFQLDQQMKQANATWLKDNPVSSDYTEFTGTLPAQINAGRYSTEEQLLADIDRTNADYKTQTGSLTPMINNEERAQYLARWQMWKQQEDEAAKKAQAKQDDETVKRTIWMQGFAHGSPSIMSASGLDARQKAAFEQTEAAKFLTEPGLQSASNLGKLAANGYTLAPLKEKLSGTLSMLKGGGTPRQEDMQSLQMAFQKFQQTPYGLGAAEAYFGDDLPLMMEMSRLDMSEKSNQQYIKERAQAQRIGVKPTKEVMDAASDLVDSEVKPGWYQRTFKDAQHLGVGYETMLKEDMKTHTAEVMSQYPNLDSDQVLKIALSRSMKGKQVLGNMLVAGPGADKLFQTLNSHLDIPMQTPGDTRFNVAINDAIRTKVDKRYDFTVGSLNAFQNGQMYVTVTRDDGVQQNIVMSAEQVATMINQKKAKQVTQNKERRKAYQLETGMREAYRVSEANRGKM